MKWHGAKALDAALKSPPSRGAWIEIACQSNLDTHLYVAPLAGGVD